MPVPNRCIWCLGETPDVTFDVSHVLPKCVGNVNQQVLPVGIVCRKCNRYFGTKVEPVLLRDPLFHVIAVYLRLADADDMNEFRDRVFDDQHPSVGSVERRLQLNMELGSQNLEILNLQYTIKGQLSKSYSRREVALLSRAVHKMAFECLAWEVFVESTSESLDIFHPRFDVVRKWARKGEPPNPLRPVIRQTITPLEAKWACQILVSGDSVGVQLRLFGDWYAVSLTSPADKAGDDLKRWVSPITPDRKVWYLGEEFKILD